MKQEGGRADEVRFLRKHYKDGGYDEQQEQEDNKFKENLEKAVNSYSKKATTNNIERQLEYFGHKIEPFNMRQQQEMGQIDDDGYFVFTNKRRRNGDAWLESLNQDGEEALDKMRKKIKLEQREMNVWDDKKYEEAAKEDQEDNQNIKEQDEADRQIEDQNKLKPAQIKLLLAQLLPFSTSANQYIKKLKKQKNTELVDKILLLCNEYIAATGEHDILTLKKEDLEEQELEEALDAPLNNWDDDDSEQMQAEVKKKGQEKDEDDIF